MSAGPAGGHVNGFPHLFAPGRVGTLELKNRLVFAATSSELADGDGHVTDDMVEFYAERARGGTGLLVVEATYVEQEGKRLHHNAMLHDDRYIPGMRRLAGAVHAAGARIALQLNHGGRESLPEISGSVPLAPSPVPSRFTAVGDPVMPRELDLEGIRRIIRRYVEAAVRARQAGFDAVELHGAHGYLIGQFISPEANRREDEYGGDTRRRARLFVELIQGIKQALGADFPVICRMNGCDHVAGGLELGEAVEVAALLEAAGADSVSVSGGIHSSRPYRIVPGMSVARGCYVPYGAAVKARLGIPVMTVGRINTPELAEEILAHGKADFICLSRALLADPFFPAKAAAGLPDRIAPCIACNECLATIHRHKGIACTVNPMVSRELEFRPLLARAVTPKRVAVVGGGVAGMAAAVTAAGRGHEVHLFEKDGALGGQLLLAYLPPHRDELENLLRYLEREVKRLGVTVRLGRAFTPDDSRQLSPDAIILATGAEAQRPGVPGVDLPHVVMGWRVIAGLEETGRNCVIIGGGLVGMEAADYLAHRGKRVIVIARSELLKKAVHADRVYFLDRIRDLGIEVLTHTRVREIGPDSVEIEPPGGWRRVLKDVDSVVLCTGYRPRTEQRDAVGALGIPVHLVGDVQGSRKFFEAVEEGTLAAVTL
ncbi:MAG: FAD-dependent oxidoreductase [Candidatus Rokubacteria bacterium]|nr:FAD-dependent oxidoreductase [Candidatus Rokubacteria bacterium]MBI3107345.1 FAD-dependent oxidoreductase [Candidatus Rokubacteria bacterium]